MIRGHHRWAAAVCITATAAMMGAVAPAASAKAKPTTSCTGTLASGTYGSITVPAGQSCTIGSGVIVTKDVKVSNGATLNDSGASIGHDVHATAAASVTISGGNVGHDVHASGSSGPVGVSGTTVGHDVHIDGSAAAVTVSSATINHDLHIDGNAGVVTVSGNTVSHDIHVDNNKPGGATIQGNTDGKCKQNNNHPYTGSTNNKPGNCNGSNP